MATAWGLDSYGETNLPAGLSNVTMVAAGVYHSIALVNYGIPSIVRQSSSQTVAAGASDTLSVTAAGAPSVYYQWMFNGTNVEGATNAVLILTNVPLTSAGTYVCSVSNFVGGIESVPITLGVLRSVPRFDLSEMQMTGAGFSLGVAALSGHGPVIVYASSDLTNWAPIYTNPPVLGALQLLDPSATNVLHRFYRVVEQ